jgi:hypothetical protein
VEHLGDELDLGRLGGVFLRELEFQLEQTAVPCGSFGSLDEGSPEKEVAFFWGGVDAFVFLVAHFGEVSDESLFCRGAHTSD